jgi:sigma-B regulation protein RsbU (phosphoserine phosphatase)
MCKTLRLQLLCAAAVAVFTAISGMMWFSFQYVSKEEVRNIKEKKISDDAKAIQAEISNRFNYLLVLKAASIIDLHEDLKRSLGGLFRKGSDVRGILNGRSERREEAWRNLVADQPAKDTKFLLLDHGKVLLTSDPVFRDLDSRSFIGMNEKSLSGTLSGSSLSPSGEFIVFHLQDQQQDNVIWKLGYFIPLSGQGMMLCAVMDISKFAEAEKKIIQEIQDELRGILPPNAALSSKGFAFIFDKQGTLLVPPPKKWKKIFQDQLNDKDRRDAFIEKTREKSSIALSFPKKLLVYTGYFKGLDWYYSIAIPNTDILREATLLAGKQMVVPIVAFGLCFLLLAALLARAVRPLEILSRKIEQAGGHDFNKGDQVLLLDGLPLSSRNEIGKLAQEFAFMVKELTVSTKKLVATTKANERIESELNIAREIQLGTLPKDFSFEPERKALEIYAYLLPALEVGGDLYDFFFIDDDHLCFTVGDVAGKGVPAALFMIITKKLVSSNARLGCSSGKSPAEMMTSINELLCKENPSAMFVTLLIGVLNVKSGELRYANGGHVSPIFSPCDDAPAYYKKDLSGPVVGVFPNVIYRDITVILEPGAAVFLCTDGVTEAMNEKDELFGDKRLLEEFTSLRDAPCRQAVDDILSKIKLYAGTAPQSDDIAMLMVRWGVEEEKVANSQPA